MKKNINASKNKLYRLVMESVHNVLMEEELTYYTRILQDEYTKAQKDVQNSRATFHRGIRNALLQKGYTVTTFCDNYIQFYGPSRLFGFAASQNYNDFRKPWNLSDYINISFSNYTWQEMYQYPSYYHTRDNKKIRLDEFTEFYQKITKQIGEPLILKPFKTAYEDIEENQQFEVIESGPNYYKKLGKFDNLEEAKKAAYKIADEQCKRGKRYKDITSEYYHFSPIDVTKDFTEYAAAYEYYDYKECTYYVLVEPI